MYVSHQGGTLFDETVPSRRDTFRSKKFGRVPAAVIGDVGLEDRDVRVFAALASLERRGEITAGLRTIAKASRVPKNCVSRSIARLEAGNHLSVDKTTRGRRQSYRLLYDVFTAKSSSPERRPLNAADSKPNDPIVKCGQCSAGCRRVGKSGLCRTCVRRSNVEREVAEILAKHPEATEEQVYVAVKARNAKDVRAAIRKMRTAAA